MSKIVILVHEHPNETPITRTRATQVKRILEKVPFNHEVEIATQKCPVQPNKFANELMRAKSEEEAFGMLREYKKTLREFPITRALLELEAKKFPDAHVFSFHGTRSHSPSALPAKSVALPLLDDNFLHKTFARPKRFVSSWIYHNNPATAARILGIVENAYAPHVYPEERPFAKSRQAKLVRLFEKWEALEPAQDFGEYLQRVELRNFVLPRTRDYARGRGNKLAKEEHAQALAEKIHELVVEAEKG